MDQALRIFNHLTPEQRSEWLDIAIVACPNQACEIVGVAAIDDDPTLHRLWDLIMMWESQGMP